MTKNCISVETWITSAYITNYQLYGQKPSKPDGKDQEQDGADHGGEVEKENPEQDAREEAAGFLGVLSISMMVVGMFKCWFYFIFKIYSDYNHSEDFDNIQF